MNLNKQQLEARVNKLIKTLGTIKIKNVLAGGVVSDVYSAILKTKTISKNIVVKYTKDNISASKIFAKSDVFNSFSGAQTEHNLDVSIQKILHMSTPKIIQHFPDDNITIMENFVENGYTFLQSRLIEKTLPLKAAQKLGATLATIKDTMAKQTTSLRQIESSQTQFDERFLELKVLLYNGRINIFNKIEDDFLSSNNALVWTDGDQKNFALNEDGEVIFFDLGRSIQCDSDFMLPNLLGHLGLFSIAGYLKNATVFLNTCRESFEKKHKQLDPTYKLDESKFINYFTASLLHRGMAMRWIDPRISDNIGEDSLKNACIHFGDVVFDKKTPVTTIEELLIVLEKITKHAQAGNYKRVPLN